MRYLIPHLFDGGARIHTPYNDSCIALWAPYHYVKRFNMVDYLEEYKNKTLSLQDAYAKAYEQYWKLLNEGNQEYESANKIMGVLEFTIITQWMETKGYESSFNKWEKTK